MLVTDSGDEMCWRQLWDVGDGFAGYCQQYPLSFNKSVGQQQPKDVTISKFCHLHPKIITKIKSPTSTCHQNLSLAGSRLLFSKIQTKVKISPWAFDKAGKMKIKSFISVLLFWKWPDILKKSGSFWFHSRLLITPSLIIYI